MRSLYNLLTHLGSPVLGVLGMFSPKMKAFVDGRKGLFEKLEQQMAGKQNVIWMHCASLGEYEQGLPVLEELAKKYPTANLIVSFFSPSGYEIKHKSAKADVVTYLPLDTKANAKRFLDLVNPKLAIFVKYEVWPNFFFELQERQIPNLMISALFRKDQAFFKPTGSLLFKALQTVDWIFVQNRSSLQLLNSHGFESTSRSGDTRFDRVSHQIEQDNKLDFMEQFCSGQTTFVIGSSWPEDEAVFLDFINSEAAKQLKTVVAPHSMNPKGIERLAAALGDKAVRFTKTGAQDLQKAKVLILDTVGYLTKVYYYADIAYVGGAMGNTGLHNILEPATFGVPIIIGKNFAEFPEAVKLLDLAGLYAVDSAAGFTEIMTKMLADEKFRSQTGMICEHYINSNTGATAKIMDKIQELYGDRLV
ncbi:3-deoxy-D-manno-octulosonic acid transferase [Gilvibacter sp.]|uniref:3-deoxy-D-manno-octulosonic acid transferase n=1 Tax=Gilvibacter sp. TaxID=2729997 RepID=UPI003B51C2AF